MSSQFVELVTSPESIKEAFAYKKEPQRSVDLDAAEWAWATWRKQPPLTRAEPKPFDLAAARAKPVAPPNWYQEPLAAALSTDEALFWLAVMMGKGGGESASFEALRNRLLDGKLPLAQMKDIVARSRFDKERACALIPMPVLAALMTPEDLVVWMSESTTILSAFLEFRKRVLLFLSPAERESLRAVVKPMLSDTTRWASEKNMAHYLAAALGMHDETRELVESWTDDYGARGWHLRLRVLQYIVFGLASAAEVEKQARRLKLLFDDPQLIAGWLAHNEHHAIDVLAATFDASARDTEKLPKLLAALSKLDAPEVAPFMFEFSASFRGLWRKDAPMNMVANAVAWLEQHPGNAAIGLVPFVKVSRKSADDVLAQLRAMVRAGHAAAVEAALDYYANPSERIRSEVLEAGNSLAPEFDDASTPKWLTDVLSATAPVGVKEIFAVKAKKSRLPEWLNVEELPPISIGEHRLNREQILEVLVAIQGATATDTPPIVPLLRQHVDSANLEAFALKMFDSWLQHKAPNPDRWMLHALGQMGGDRAALRLPPLIRQWRAGGNQPHAAAGLEALRALGTDTALTQLNIIANDQRLKALHERAIVHVEAIAAGLGLSRERLEDRLIPTCGMDENEATIFDFGGRKFSLVINLDLSPALKDETTGALRDDLPKPNSSDDPQRVKECTERWKFLKKELKATLQAQTARLEQALVGQRRWFADEFERLLVQHPAVGHLIRRLAWTGFDSSGAMIGIFRVCVDGKFVNLDQTPLPLNGFAEIGLLHPLRVRREVLDAWRELFANLEITQPFPQLDRDVHPLTTEEETQKSFRRMKDFILPAVSIPSVLDKRGWVRGAVESGIFNEHSKYFPDGNVTAVCMYQGVPLYYQEAEDQYIDDCFFVAGKVVPTFDRDVKKALKEALTLNDVDPVVISEVLRDLFELSKRAKSHAYE